jgi:hypothetical protein
MRRHLVRALRLGLQDLPDPLDAVYTPRIETMRDFMVELREGLGDDISNLDLLQLREYFRYICAVIDDEYKENGVQVGIGRDTVASRARMLLRCIDDHLAASNIEPL